MASNENLKLSSGPGEPKSPNPSLAAPSPGAAAQIVSQVRVRPLASYVKDGVIDTNLLGSEPIGAQTGKNGPERQKFLCSVCRRKRWVIDSEAGSAAAMTYRTTCSFCDVRAYVDKVAKQQTSSLLAELNKLQKRLEDRLDLFGERLLELESGPSVQVGASRSTGDRSPTGLREEFDSLRSQLLSEVKSMKSRVGEAQKTTEVRKSPATAMVRNGDTFSSVAARKPPSPLRVQPGASSSRDAENYIEEVYNRCVVQIGPTAGRQRTVVQDSTSVRGGNSTTTAGKKKNRRRRKKNRTGNDAAKQGRDIPPEEKPVNLLVGDSMVGRETSKFFTGLDTNNRCRSLPGAGVKEITAEVQKLAPAQRNTLILSVGGNDVFRRDRRPVNVGALMEDFSDLLRVARSKTGRCVVIGILPRKYCDQGVYNQAGEVNRKLEELCRQRSCRFINPWCNFFGMDGMYQRDGVHFSSLGSKVFARLVNLNLYGAPRIRSRQSRPKNPEIEARRPAPNPKKKKKKRKPATRATTSGAGSAVRATPSALAEVCPTVSPVAGPSGLAVSAKGGTLGSTSEANKRPRSSLMDISVMSLSQSPRQKRRRASEGEGPDPSSPPLVRNSSPRQPGNGLRPE